MVGSGKSLNHIAHTEKIVEQLKREYAQCCIRQLVLLEIFAIHYRLVFAILIINSVPHQLFNLSTIQLFNQSSYVFPSYVSLCPMWYSRAAHPPQAAAGKTLTPR